MITHARALLALSLVAAPLSAQDARPAPICAGGALAVTLPGGLGDENARARGLRDGTPWALLRGAGDDAVARMTADSSAMPFRVAAVLPELLVTSNQSFPMPANDGPMWAGRGVSYSITGGVAICGARGRWGAIIAPTYWYSENANFDLPTDGQIVPPRKDGYSPWASPYFFMPRSLDMPRRFGPTALRRFEPGAFRLFFRTGPVEFGATTESEWWGPGQYNALLLSSNAAGPTRAYVRTARPIRAAGELDIRYFVGGLTYSKFFFKEPPVDSSRSVAGLALVWRPKVEPNLSIGVSRVVIAPVASKRFVNAVFDPIVPVGTPNAVGRGDSTQFPGRDQLFSVFANWRLPDDGGELWLEWARAELPENVRDLLQSPNHTQALTIGLQKVVALRPTGWTWRVGAEYSQTNQSSTYRERPTGTWYASRAVQGGFTQRGQILGAMIGPGSVTQRLGTDLAGPRFSAGLFAWRIKWDDDSFYTIPRPNGNGLCKHDVSLAYGVRGSTLTPAGWVEATLTAQNRMNIWWQALGLCFANEELQVDQRNLSLEFRVRPHLRRGAR